MNTTARSVPQDLRMEARRLASYLPDDLMIANYLGTTREVVAAERAKLRRVRTPAPYAAEASPLVGDEIARAEVGRLGSEELHRRIMVLFTRAAIRRGCSVQQAAFAILNPKGAARPGRSKEPHHG